MRGEEAEERFLAGVPPEGLPAGKGGVRLPLVDSNGAKTGWVDLPCELGGELVVNGENCYALIGGVGNDGGWSGLANVWHPARHYVQDGLFGSVGGEADSNKGALSCFRGMISVVDQIMDSGASVNSGGNQESSVTSTRQGLEEGEGPFVRLEFCVDDSQVIYQRCFGGCPMDNVHRLVDWVNVS